MMGEVHGLVQVILVAAEPYLVPCLAILAVIRLLWEQSRDRRRSGA